MMHVITIHCNLTTDIPDGLPDDVDTFMELFRDGQIEVTDFNVEPINENE